jgi:hypothetical protein
MKTLFTLGLVVATPARWPRLKKRASSRGIFVLATTKVEAQEDIALAITSTAVAAD